MSSGVTGRSIVYASLRFAAIEPRGRIGFFRQKRGQEPEKPDAPAIAAVAPAAAMNFRWFRNTCSGVA